MLPYFYLSNIPILGIPTHSFFTLLGFLVAGILVYFRVKKFGLDKNQVLGLFILILIAGQIGARLGYVFFYEPGYYLENPWEIFQIWKGGLSSFGGFIGAVLVLLLYVKANQLPFWKWLDTLALAFPLGWGIGRIGCFLTHMHLGVKSNFPLAVAFPQGGQFELSILEALFVFILFALFIVCEKYIRMCPFALPKSEGRRRAIRIQRFPGFFVASLALSYGLVRFVLDSLRVEDIRYFYLTPAQYGSLVLIAIGVWLFVKRKRA